MSDAATAANLPDERSYEAVTPVEVEGDVDMYVPGAGGRYLDPNSFFGGITTLNPFIVAPAGNAVTYSGEPPISGEGGSGSQGEGHGDQYLAVRRTSGGWSQTDLSPTGGGGVQVQAFSESLASAYLSSGKRLSVEAPAGCIVLYSRAEATSIFQPIFTTTATPEECGEPVFAGASADGSHVVFESTGALLPEAVAEQPNLYEVQGGHLSLVNVLPGGAIAPEAGFGLGNGTAASGVISSDGARVFWTDLSTAVTTDNPAGTPRLFVREDGGAAIRQIDESDGPGVSGDGRFLAATKDGEKVFFSDCSRLTANSTAVKGAEGCITEKGPPLGAAMNGNDLYEYNTTSNSLTDITVDSNVADTLGADVQGLLGTSENGSYVYFVARGLLAENSNRQLESAIAGEDNVYVRHNGVTLFVARLSPQDGDEVLPFSGESAENAGDWRASVSKRTAEVTPDGQHLLFMSNRPLTGYNAELDGERLDEVFLYGAVSEELHCVSCNPNNVPPVPTQFNSAELEGHVGAFVPISRSRFSGDTHQTVGMTANGERVFFDSAQPLVATDTNRWVDVYEWENDNTGSCRRAGGCIFVLTTGTYPESSWLLGADASGEDVFVLTRAQLVPQDRNGDDDVYDVRVHGGQQPVAPSCINPACGRTSAAAPVPTAAASLPTLTFEGVGNIPPPPSAVTKPAAPTQPAKRCKKNYIKRNGKCVKRGRQAGRAKKSRSARRSASVAKQKGRGE